MIWIEIQFWNFVKWVIRRGYGANCASRDTDDFPGLPENARCGSCRAAEVIDWIDRHIELIKM